MSSQQCWYPQGNLESVPFRAIWLTLTSLSSSCWEPLPIPYTDQSSQGSISISPAPSLTLLTTSVPCHSSPLFPVSQSSTFYSSARNKALASIKYLALNASPWSWTSGPHWICHCFTAHPLPSRFCAPTVTLPVTPLQPGPQWEVTSHPLSHSQAAKACLHRPVAILPFLSHWSLLLTLFIILPNHPLLSPHLYT